MWTDPTIRKTAPEAFKTVTAEGKFALGVLYVNEQRIPFEENLPAYQRSNTPLYMRDTGP